MQAFNSSPPGQNADILADDNFGGIFFNEKWYNFDLNFTEICSQESN